MEGKRMNTISLSKLSDYLCHRVESSVVLDSTLRLNAYNKSNSGLLEDPK